MRAAVARAAAAGTAAAAAAGEGSAEAGAGLLQAAQQAHEARILILVQLLQ